MFVSEVATIDREVILAVLDKVPDPEIPALTITGLECAALPTTRPES